MPLIVPFHVGERVEGFPQPPGSQVLAPALPAGSAPERMIVLFRELANRVAEDGASLVYTGDCMAPLGVLAGLQRRGLTPFVVWLDAHGDFNTWETSPSGYIGGMPLAMAVGLGDQSIVDGLELQRLEPRRVVLSDARDVDPEESVALAGSGVRMAGIGEVADCVPGDRPIYVHLDVDVITPGEMPALRFPAAGGPSLAQVAEALRVLARTERIVCATIGCTWDPSRPRAAEAFAATETLVACLSSPRSSS